MATVIEKLTNSHIYSRFTALTFVKKSANLKSNPCQQIINNNEVGIELGPCPGITISVSDIPSTLPYNQENGQH